MWYSKGNMRMLFMFGAAMAFIGLGLITMDYPLPGVLLLCIGIFLVVIAFAVLRFHVMLSFRR